MKTIKLLSFLLIGLILMSFIPPPLDITGKYMTEIDPRPPIAVRKLDIRADSMYTSTFITDIAHIVDNGRWFYIGDTLTTVEIIDPHELPQNKMDSMYFDFDRPFVDKYYVVNRDTLIWMNRGYRIRYVRVTDKEFDKYKFSR